jgi:transcription-repair coupling factor (superfamily II helicase)
MSAFYERKYDVLLSTTIVESGIDIPSANTIIIHRADRFGLAQLYQLRGRVGRSKLRAYAYLTTAAGKALTEASEKRLKVLGDLDSLGAGFQLASHDLDIRGAGNLLGDEQSGHIARWASNSTSRCWRMRSWQPRRATGLERDAPGPEPADHRRCADHDPRGLRPRSGRAHGALSPHERCRGSGRGRGAVRRNDRPLRPLPPATANLVQLIQIKRQAIEAHIAKVDVGAKGTLVSFHNDSFPIRQDWSPMLRVWKEPSSCAPTTSWWCSGHGAIPRLG